MIMYTWCSNNLTITADNVEGESQLASLLTLINTASFDLENGLFSTFHPHPFSDDASDNQFIEQFTWCMLNWGTKKDVSYRNVKLVQKDKSIKMIFDTVWAPPGNFVEHLSLLYPNLRFVHSFSECESGIAGTTEIQNGITINSRKVKVSFLESVDKDGQPIAIPNLDWQAFLTKYELWTGG